MSENVIQTSFSGGELSPSMFARVDFAKYRSGAATMRNFFVDYRSGSSTRAGTEFIRPTVQFNKPVRVVRFQQSVDVTYVLEFGDFYIRFITQGASVVETAVPITFISNSTFANITAPGNPYTTGDLVFVTGVQGMPQVNNRYFLVSGPGATFGIQNSLNFEHINSFPWGTYASGGTVARVYTIGTPYSADELALLKFSQKGSIMNITHPNHPPYKLTLISATNWTLAPAVFGSTAGSPVVTSIVGTSAGAAFYGFSVTGVDVNNQESPPFNGSVDNVMDMRTTAGSIQLTWTGAPNSFAYNTYATSPSFVGAVPASQQRGFIGSVLDPTVTFTDTNIDPDFSQSPPIANNPFIGVNPACSAYFQQRLVYANGGVNISDKFWMSRTGSYYNFDISNPIQANDSIEGELVSLEVNEIKSMIPMPSGLILLTTHGAWQISGGGGGVAQSGGPVTPSTITATSQAFIGANDVPPILINYDILFIQQKGSIVRDLTYNIYSNIYTGNDISILSSHLFYGHQVLEWAYAEEPFKVIWCVREDGILLSLTILKEQDMYGWARHDTHGFFRSVCTVTEGTVDATYVVVDRPDPTNPTVFFKQIERIAERTFPYGAEDAWCVDAGLKTIPNTPFETLFPVATPDSNGFMTVIASGVGGFNSGNIGWVLRMSGGIYRVTQVFSATQIQVQQIQPANVVVHDDPNGPRPAPGDPGEWSLDEPFTNVYGLDHLEGQQVSVLADGGVINGLTVTNGTITLPQPATKVIAGLGFQAQLQTMYLDLGNEINTTQGKRKKIAALTVRCKDSRAVKAGRTFGTVTPIKELNRTTILGTPIPLVTADERIVMDPLWDVPGQICLQVDDPLPASVLGVIPEIIIGDTPK